MNLWKDLAATALLGTERQAPALPKDGSLGKLCAALDVADREGALLGAAGAMALYQRAGRLAATIGEPLPEPCPSDELPCCSPRAAGHLGAMLGGQHRAALPEWLAAAARAGKRVPPEYLPALLDWGGRDSDWRELVVPLLDRRGRWLAAQRKEWSYATGDPNAAAEGAGDELWQTGSRGARLLFLKELRRREPARARELLVSTWTQESAADRSAFVAALEIGLSMDDEPWLESVLDDKSKEVRRLAAGLLARLPESRLVARMFERARPMLTLEIPKKSKTKKLRVEVTFPAEFPEAWLRDTLAPIPTDAKGLKAAWLHQMLSVVPPWRWCEVFGKTPIELLGAAEAGDWGRELWQAWAEAARRHDDVAWAEAILLETATWEGVAVDKLWGVLSVERREALVLQSLRDEKTTLRGKHPALPLLEQCHHVWSVELSRAVLDAVRCVATDTRDYNDWRLGQLFQQFVLYIPPSMAAVATAWPTEHENWPHWRQSVDEMLALLQFRKEMLEEF